VRETLLHRLREKLACPTLSPAHRIDRDTAGLVLFIKHPEHRAAYHNLFRDRLVEKTYLALAAPLDVMQYGIAAHIPDFQGLSEAERWQLLHSTGADMHSWLAPSGQSTMQMRCDAASLCGQSNAQTHIKIIAAQAGFKPKNGKNMLKNTICYELHPSTGQRHQLRAQMNALGVPIAGDGIYPVLTPECATPHEQPPLQLLAQRLAFIDPLTGQWRAFCSQRQLGAAAAVL
jgi:tRNA pseudouridine32 synthase/23S rRNA pseudouridine746 synthase